MQTELTTTRFILEENHQYELGQSVPVYLLGNEVIGSATVVEISPTSVRELNGEVIPHNDVTFEFDNEIKESGAKKYSPFYNGRSGKLCVQDNEMIEKMKRQQHEYKVNRVKKQDLSFKYVCLKCESVIASSREFKSSSCKHCRGGRLEKVSFW